MAIAKSRKEPKPPRRPTFAVAQFPVEDTIHSVIRTSWFKNGRLVEVDELQLLDCSDALTVFQWVVGQALRQGADVTVLTAYAPADLGVPE